MKLLFHLPVVKVIILKEKNIINDIDYYFNGDLRCYYIHFIAHPHKERERERERQTDLEICTNYWLLSNWSKVIFCVIAIRGNIEGN